MIERLINFKQSYYFGYTPEINNAKNIVSVHTIDERVSNLFTDFKLYGLLKYYETK